jgi:cysteine synthase B
MPGAIDEAHRMQQAGLGSFLTSLPIRIIRWRIMKAPARKSGPIPRGITHFVSSMGTTGTIMGNSRFLKEKNPAIQIIGVQPETGSQIPGIRKWEDAYLPKICDFSRIDQLIHVSQQEAEDTARQLAREEGILAGPSSGGALAVALRLNQQLENAVIVSIVCDRGDRYLSTGLFPL